MPEKNLKVPDGVDIRLEGETIIVRGEKGELKRTLKNPNIKIEISGNLVKFNLKGERRKDLAALGTFAALFKSMIYGVTKGFEVKLKIVYSHFPIKFGVEGNHIIIQNFLGEKKPRTTTILPGTEIKVDKDIVTITGIDKESVGHSAARIEQICKVSGRDRRVFSDGIWILSKCKVIEEVKNEK